MISSDNESDNIINDERVVNIRSVDKSQMKKGLSG